MKKRDWLEVYVEDHHRAEVGRTQGSRTDLEWSGTQTR